MFREKDFYGQNPLVVVRSSPKTFNLPLTRAVAMRRKLERGEPLGEKDWAPGDLVFTCSWSDVFHPAADAWRDEFWKIVKATPEYIYQILTKRSNRIAAHLPDDWGENGYPNVWLGATIEYQTTIFRVDQIAAVPAPVTFISYEPCVGPVDWTQHDAVNKVQWIIVGGESGRLTDPEPEKARTGNYKVRPFDEAWLHTTIEQAQRATGNVAVWMKQYGSQWAHDHGWKHSHGADPAEWPEWARVQELPEYTPPPEQVDAIKRYDEIVAKQA